MSAFSKKYESRAGNILDSDERKRLTRSFVHDLVNQLAVIVGHCDLLSDDMKQGSQSAKRVVAIQEIGRGMAQELNEYQYRLSKSVRSVGMKKRDVA
jgi:2-phospho-L-lactate guanylyltransferase (CobY/MobA/RfbA family)